MKNTDFQSQILSAVLILKKSRHNTVSMKDLKEIGITIPKPKELKPIKIQKIRKKFGFSQAVFAETLNVSPETIKHWEHGKRKPSGIALKVLRVLEKRPEFIEELL